MKCESGPDFREICWNKIAAAKLTAHKELNAVLNSSLPRWLAKIFWGLNFIPDLNAI